MKQHDEQAGLIHGGLMLHGLAGREVGVCARPNNPAIGIQPPLQHDDRMGGGVAVQAASDAGRIADEVVLFARSRVLVEEPQRDRPVVNRRSRGLGFLQLERPEVVDDRRLAISHPPILSRELISVSRDIENAQPD